MNARLPEAARDARRRHHELRHKWHRHLLTKKQRKTQQNTASNMLPPPQKWPSTRSFLEGLPYSSLHGTKRFPATEVGNQDGTNLQVRRVSWSSWLLGRTIEASKWYLLCTELMFLYLRSFWASASGDGHFVDAQLLSKSVCATDTAKLQPYHNYCNWAFANISG